MRKLLAILLILATVGCATQTEYGKCIGIDGRADPNLIYEVSARNVIIAIFFLETLIVPFIVLVDEIKCPISKK